MMPYVTTMGDRTGGGSGFPFNSELPNGWGVRFSASPMLDVNKQHTEFGIDPDIELEYEYLDPDGEQYEIQYDNQVQKAIEVLSEKTQND